MLQQHRVDTKMDFVHNNNNYILILIFCYLNLITYILLLVFYYLNTTTYNISRPSRI